MSRKDAMYFGGVPTEPDIRLLRSTYPEADMKPGDRIGYKEVAKLIGSPPESSRFRGVTNRWRKLIETETGSLILGTIAGEAFVVLDEVQKIDLGHGKLRTAVRTTKRAYVITSRVDIKDLPQEERDRLMALQRRSAAILSTAQIKSTADLPKLEK